MNNINRKTYEKIAMITGIIVGFVFLLGISYAIFRTSDVGKKINKIQTANFGVVIENESEEAIELANAYPISDEEGLKGKYYEFDVRNTGSISARYNLTLEVPNEVTLNTNRVKYNLIEDEKEITIEPLLLGSKEQREEENKKLYQIDTDVIKAGEKKHYKLQMWLDYEATIEDTGKTFTTYTRIDAEQYNGNHNIVKVLKYNENKKCKDYCITGAEETCAKSNCYLNKEKGACPSGTIFIYNVNDTSKRYFYVLHDDGEEMTLQQRENISNQAAWSLETDESGNYTNTKGPTEALRVLEEATKDWTNVEEQTYTLGETVFLEGSNAYTGCSKTSCTTNVYTMETHRGKARMITVQEANHLGCTGAERSCPIYISNYLGTSTSYGGTVNADTPGYWTMNGESSRLSYALSMLAHRSIYNGSTTNYQYNSCRAVIVINK